MRGTTNKFDVEGSWLIVQLLQKLFYGLNQAPRACGKLLSTLLVSWRFKSSQVGCSFSTMIQERKICILIVYVYDIFISGNDGHLIQNKIREISWRCQNSVEENSGILLWISMMITTDMWVSTIVIWSP